MHWQILYRFSHIKQVITSDQRFMGLLSISYVFKNLFFYILSHLFSFWKLFPPPSSPPFFACSLPHPYFHKLYPQSKTFLNIRALPSSAVFCSNAVLIRTPSSSMQFFSFFGVLPRIPTTTGMTLMFLMFHILLISLFSSSYLSIFSFSFSLTLISPGIAISIMAQLLSLLFTTTISAFLALISIRLDHNISQNLHFLIFNNTFWSKFIPFFTSFQVVFSKQLPMNYSFNIIVPTLILYSFCAKFSRSLTI